jgi:PST family polysaccharide transporter
VPIFRDEPELLAYAVVLGILQGYLPVWFFLGIERAQMTALAELTTRIAALALIVLLVRDESDGEIVLAVYTGAAAASVSVTTVMMYRRVTPLRPTRAWSRDALRRGRTLFAGTGATAFYTGANAFLIGLILPPAQVAIFAAAEKVVRAGNRVLGLMAQAVYPRASRLVGRGDAVRARRLSNITLLFFGGIALASAGLVALFADPIVNLVFGSEFEDAVPLMRIMALVVPLNVIGVVLMTQRLLPLGLDRRVTAIFVSASLINAALVVLAAETSGLRTTAWAVVAVEVFVLAATLTALRHSGGAQVVGEPDGQRGDRERGVGEP